MIRFLIFGFLAYFFYRALKRIFGAGQKIGRSENGGIIDEMVQDPMCKTYIPLRDAHRRTIGGKEYFFCSRECAENFDKKMKK